MKYTLVLIFGLLLTHPAVGQRVLIVDNTGLEAEGEHVYTDLQMAINESQSGDIIHVVHSPNSYGSITISGKSNVTFIGIGYYADVQIPSVRYFSELGEVNINNSTNLTFRGLFSDDNGTNRGFQIENNNGSSVTTDIFIEECVFQDLVTGTRANRIVITNSYIFSDFNLFGSNHTIANSIIKDGVPVINRTDITNSLITNFSGITGNDINFTNNIFLYTGSGTNDPLANRGFSFVHNFFNEDVGAAIGNFYENNIVQELAFNEIFEQDISDGSSWSGYNELTLKSALLINAGNDGTDIGPTGGSSPHSRSLLSLPSIIELITPTKVQEGQDFEVILRAKSN